MKSHLAIQHATFAAALRSERQRLGMTQAECAAALHVSLRSIIKWEQGQGPIQLTQEGAIARLAALKPA